MEAGGGGGGGLARGGGFTGMGGGPRLSLCSDLIETEPYVDERRGWGNGISCSSACGESGGCAGAFSLGIAFKGMVVT
jgi:hypothetical protein